MKAKAIRTMLKFFDYKFRINAIKEKFLFLIENEYKFYSKKIFNFMEEFILKKELSIIFIFDSRNNVVNLKNKNKIGNTVFEMYDLCYSNSANMKSADKLINEIIKIKINRLNDKYGLNKTDFDKYIDCYKNFIVSNMNMEGQVLIK